MQGIRVCVFDAYGTLFDVAAAARDLFGWQRGETTASPAEIMAFNGITAAGLSGRARELLGDRATSGERAA